MTGEPTLSPLWLSESYATATEWPREAEDWSRDTGSGDRACRGGMLTGCVGVALWREVSCQGIWNVEIFKHHETPIRGLTWLLQVYR